MITLRVQNPKYDHPIFLNPIKDFIWKPLCDQSTKAIVIRRPIVGLFSEGGYGTIRLA